jgi:hypothetical protein
MQARCSTKMYVVYDGKHYFKFRCTVSDQILNFSWQWKFRVWCPGFCYHVVEVMVFVHLMIQSLWFGAGVCSSVHSDGMSWCWCLFIWSSWRYDLVLVSVHMMILTVCFGAGVFIHSFWRYELVLVSVHLIILTVWFGAGVFIWRF